MGHPMMRMAQEAAAAAAVNSSLPYNNNLIANQTGGEGGGNIPSLNSWPLSSVVSLNNLGTLAGVKKIASLSGADLATQGNIGKKGNLAQVESEESMGRADSYAF